MNKNAIQKFAIWARNELIAQVSQRAYQYGIDESGFGDASADTLNGRLLTAEEKSQRQELIKQIKEKGYQQVMEEVAYTWFNRFIALRFMEVNNYLPSHIRVFSDASGAFKPEILNDVLHLDLPGLDSGKVAEYIESNDTEASTAPRHTGSTSRWRSSCRYGSAGASAYRYLPCRQTTPCPRR